MVELAVRKANWLHQVTSPEFDFPPRQATLPYVILGSPRTGTTMLCSSLISTGQAGYPMEYLGTLFLDHFVNPSGEFRIDQYLAEVTRRRTSPNGRFGIKILTYQFTGLFRKRPDIGMQMMRGFKRYIHVYRRDKVDQAISGMLAHERGIWNTENPNERPPERGFQPSDVEAINDRVKRITREDSFWRNLSQQVPMAPLLEVAYEDLVQNTQREIARVLEHLDVHIAPEDVPLPTTVKLAREGSREIKRQYLLAVGQAAA